MRRILVAGFAALALAVAANPAEAQFKIGPQAAVITSIDSFGEGFDLNGDFGLGGRAEFQPPLLPFGAYGSATYYFVDCGTIDCGYWTASLGAKVGLPLVVVFPYLHGGWQWRRTSVEGMSDTQSGAFIGLGADVNLGIRLFIEGAMEFNDDIGDLDTDPIVIKVGVLFGD